MKTDDKVRQYRSDVVGTSVRMGIAEGAEAHLMDVLTKMYSDPEQACIREYSTNARDSHIEAKQERPIEVTLPTPYLPTLTIRDYGIGLDEQGIRELYSQYGASTKRDTNSAQGMLGIGCKSALAYTDQFTVVGYRGGARTQVIVSRDEDGCASQTIVSVDFGAEGETYEDGVEVTIPVKADNSIEEKAHDFFRFWPKGSVVFKSGDKLEEPRPIGAEDVSDDNEGGEFRNIWLDDSTLLTNEVGEDLVVMGYVAYPLVDGDAALFACPKGPRTYHPKHGYMYPKAFSAVCFVDIGEVNFAPSRESLRTSKRTKDKLDELRTHVKDTFEQSVRDKISAATTAKEAQDLLIAGRAMGFNAQPPAQWKGHDVLLTLKRFKTLKAADGSTYESAIGDEASVEDCLRYSYLFSDRNRYSRKRGDRIGKIDLTNPSLTIFTGFEGKWLTNVKRAKLELWASQRSIVLGKTVFVDKLNKDEKFWTNGWTIYDWTHVEATELPKNTTADGGVVRLKGSYTAIVNGQVEYGLPAHKIDTSKPIYYCHGNEWTLRGSRAVRSGAVPLSDGTFVALSRNRIEKFTRDFPMAVEITTAARRAAKEWESKVDRDEVKAYTVAKHSAGRVLKSLKDEDFDDAALNTLIRLANTSCTVYSSGLDKYGAYIDPPHVDATWKFIENTIKKYPLAGWSDYQAPTPKVKEHTVLYLNAAIAAEKE